MNSFIENIMVANPKDLSSIKLIDFGLSVKYDEISYTSMLNDRCGTVIFMAPEVLLSKEYTKSVDMWSIGILMYMLISGGKHPFYKKGMTITKYCDVLSQKPEVTFESGRFSKLSEDLITKFLQFETIKRYSVYQALKHPWITRCNETDIPDTFDQVIENMAIREKLGHVMKVLYAASVVKTKNQPKAKNSRNYLKLLKKVTKTIDIWGQRKRKLDFENDEDFIERQGSPTKFDSVSNLSVSSSSDHHLSK